MIRGKQVPTDVQEEIKKQWLAGKTIVSIALAFNVARNTAMRYASENYSVAKRGTKPNGAV